MSVLDPGWNVLDRATICRHIATKEDVLLHANVPVYPSLDGTPQYVPHGHSINEDWPYGVKQDVAEHIGAYHKQRRTGGVIQESER